MTWNEEFFNIMQELDYNSEEQSKIIKNLKQLLKDDRKLDEFMEAYGLSFFDYHDEMEISMKNLKSYENPFLLMLKKYYNITASEFFAHLIVYDKMSVVND